MPMYDVAEIMSTDLVTLTPADTLNAARQIMQDRRIRHIPVLEDGRLVGLVTQRDVLAALDSDLDETGDDALAERADRVRISQFMSRNVATVSEDADLRAVARFLEKHKFGCAPVVRGEQLVGLVTESDIVAVAINLLEQLEAAESPEMDDDNAGD
jgi:CBS domain-containing protein